MAPSGPRTKTSMTPLDGDVAAGDDVRIPPREFQLDHDVAVSYDLCHIAASVSRAKTSRRPEPHEQAAGPVPAEIWPAIETQLPQKPPT